MDLFEASLGRLHGENIKIKGKLRRKKAKTGLKSLFFKVKIHKMLELKNYIKKKSEEAEEYLKYTKKFQNDVDNAC